MLKHILAIWLLALPIAAFAAAVEQGSSDVTRYLVTTDHVKPEITPMNRTSVSSS